MNAFVTTRGPRRCGACNAKYEDSGHHCVRTPAGAWPTVVTMDIESVPKSAPTGRSTDWYEEAEKNMERWLQVPV